MSKLDKSIKNARVAFLFYFITLVISFVSRKIFIETLGTELVGLSATMQNILGFLNLAELGIYSAVSYSLYKPIVDKNHNEINRIISLFGYLYRVVGLAILGVGIIVSIFLPLIFKKSDLSWIFIYGAYYTFLSVTLFTYFNNFRQVLLAADQKNYIVTEVTNYAVLFKVILQIVYLKYLHGNYIGWLVLEFVFGLFTRWWTNHRVIKEYPWLKINLKEGKHLLKEYPVIRKNIKDLFIHKIAEFAGGQADNILIFAFASLSTVTLYTNYTMITKRIATLVISTLGSNLAGVGHVIAEGNIRKTTNLFKEFNGLFFFIGGLLVYVLYYMTNPFIALWLGDKFILTESVFLLILFNAYVTFTRSSILFFVNGYGLYKDNIAALMEAAIKLGASIILGYFYGLFGVLLGTMLSSLSIICIWKPYFLFREGFKMSVWNYWKDVTIYLLLFVISIIILLPLHKFLFQNTSYLYLLLNALIIFVTFALIYGVLMYFFGAGVKQVSVRLTNKFLRKKKQN
ncbi:Sugar transporter [uncultured Paludibacter sp.]|uniref:Sugar transporter n=1 Tax=uncultured Paludibacter sp. TaxID=497635 RepID=A0A653A9J9_9BACT|nr:Sugar transporter [uncultured Paludibacter sp.]